VTTGPVCVVGNLTTDLIIHRVPALPGWGQETVGAGHTSIAAGQAAHLARGLQGLGCATRVVGVVGDDPEGARIRDELAARGIDVGAIVTCADLPTAISVALVRPDGERAFVSDLACQRLLDRAFIERFWASVETSTALCVVGLFNLPSLSPDAALPLLARARAAGVPTMLDTGWDPGQWASATVAGVGRLLGEVDVFLPNLDEAEALTGLRDPAAAAAALQRHGVGTVVVKCGGDGCVGLVGERVEHVPALAVEVHDAVGAGDMFDAGFMHAHLQGQDIFECMTFANAAASLYVSRTDDRHPTASEVRSTIDEAIERRPTLT
jgi:sugar/nucleoside kinase (ribokinase family)